MTRPSRYGLLRLIVLPGLAVALSGCAVAGLVGGMLQNEEYQKLVQVLPEYDLEGQSVGVVVDADLTVLYEYPRLIEQITSGVTTSIGQNVPDVRMVPPEAIIAWQWKTPQWNAMPYGELAEVLNVDRVVFIELREYRLHPPGNRWIWEGLCDASVSIIERDGYDPDMFVDTFDVTTTFPKIKNLDRSAANASQIETGLLQKFVQSAGWLFYEHVEPKYPDKFRPEAQL